MESGLIILNAFGARYLLIYTSIFSRFCNDRKTPALINSVHSDISLFGKAFIILAIRSLLRILGDKPIPFMPARSNWQRMNFFHDAACHPFDP